MINLSNVPPFIKRELDKLNEAILPLVKKASKYGLWSLPIIFFSIFNLFALLFFIPDKQNIVPTIILYAILGAFGMALSKEAKHHRKEVQKISADYVLERIEKSDIASAHLKEKYTSLVKQHPLMAINHFIQFLEAENRQNIL